MLSFIKPPWVRPPYWAKNEVVSEEALKLRLPTEGFRSELMGRPGPRAASKRSRSKRGSGFCANTISSREPKPERGARLGHKRVSDVFLLLHLQTGGEYSGLRSCTGTASIDERVPASISGQGHSKTVLKIQQQMVVARKALEETGAGREQEADPVRQRNLYERKLKQAYGRTAQASVWTDRSGHERT